MYSIKSHPHIVFWKEISDFQKIADSFLAMVDSLSVEVEAAKLKAIGSRNLLKSMAKKREAQQQQLQVWHPSYDQISSSYKC